MSKNRKFYIMAVISVPLAIAVAVSAWDEGNLRTAIVGSIIAVLYGFGFVYIAWHLGRLQGAGETPYITSKELPVSGLKKRLIVWERPFWLFTLTSAIVLFVIGVFGGRPLYILLEGVVLMVTSGGILMCGGILKIRRLPHY